MATPRKTAPAGRMVAALSVSLAAGSAPTEVRLIPAGRFRAADGSGRPEGIPAGWLLDAALAARLVAAANARQSDYVIDYEHQTLLAAQNGKPAPAAGWFKQLEFRESGNAPGLYATDVRWTAQAAAHLAAGEYRYFSPMFAFDREGRVLALAPAALTNNPGLDGLTDLSTAALSALFPDEEDAPMKELLKALGLPETATEAEALAALSALNNRLATQSADVAALTARVNKPDPAQFVAVATLTAVQGELATARTELATLKAEKTKSEVDRVIGEALSAGKLTPAMEGWARELGTSNLASLTSYIATAPVIAKPGSTQSGGKAPEGGGAGVTTDTDLAVMKALGLTAEQFSKGKQEA